MSSDRVQTSIVPTDLRGQRVDVVLAQLFPDFSRSQLSTWLKEGHITLDNQLRKPKDKVHGGEQIQLTTTTTPFMEAHQAEAIPLTIVFEDEDLLILNKPANLVVHPGAGNREHTLVNALLHHDPTLQQLPRAGIVHRLDKDTTGLLIVAKTLTAHTTLVRQMQAREIQRHYLALVYGRMISGKTIETCYGRHPRNRLKMAVCKHGKEAKTQFTIHTRYQHATLLDVTLMTGRTHQIRVHMAYLKHPIVGDTLYGGRPRIPAGTTEHVRQTLQQFNRQALHAYSLSFEHPLSQTLMQFIAPLPQDFEDLLTVLEKDLGQQASS